MFSITARAARMEPASACALQSFIHKVANVRKLSIVRAGKTTLHRERGTSNMRTLAPN